MDTKLPKSPLMGESPVLTVVIPFLNSAATLPRTLQSIAQALAVPGLKSEAVELLFIDNGCSDQSLSIIASWLAAHFNFVGLIAREPRRGVSFARNAGVFLARGKHISFIDSDDTICAEYFAAVVEELKYSPDLVVIPLGGSSCSPKLGEPLQVSSHPAGVRDLLCCISGWWTVQFISKRSLLVQIPFDGSCFEDFGVFPLVVNAAGEMRLLKKNLYNYMENEGSITRGGILDYAGQVTAQSERVLGSLGSDGLLAARVKADTIHLLAVHRPLVGEWPLRTKRECSFLPFYIRERGLKIGAIFLSRRYFAALGQKVKRRYFSRI